MVYISYYLSDGINIPTKVIEEEFETFEDIAKFCVLMGGIAGNREILPIAIDKEKHLCVDVDRDFIRQYYQG